MKRTAESEVTATVIRQAEDRGARAERARIRAELKNIGQFWHQIPASVGDSFHTYSAKQVDRLVREDPS